MIVDVIGGFVEFVVVIGIFFVIVFFIVVIFVIYLLKLSNKEKELEVWEVSGESLYD